MDNPDLNDILVSLGLNQENIELVKTLVGQLREKPRRPNVKMNCNLILPQRVRELRKNNGLSQKELAAIIGISSNTYNHYETGTASMKITVLDKLADYFRTSTDYLMGRTDLK